MYGHELSGVVREEREEEEEVSANEHKKRRAAICGQPQLAASHSWNLID